MEKGAPLLPVEREFLQQCRQNRFASSLLPGIVIGVMAKRAVPFLRPPLQFAVGASVTAGSWFVMSLASETVCVREFARQPDFPLAVALRNQLRTEHPDYALTRFFDQTHPGYDARVLAAGETKLGRIPIEYRLPNALLQELFEPQTIAQEPARPSTQLPAPTPAASPLPPLENGSAQQSYQQLLRRPPAAADAAESEFQDGAPEDLPAPTVVATAPRQAAPRSAAAAASSRITPASSSSSFLDEFFPSDAPSSAASRTSRLPVTRVAPISASAAASRAPVDSFGAAPAPGMPKLRLTRNEYGDEVWVEE